MERQNGEDQHHGALLKPPRPSPPSFYLHENLVEILAAIKEKKKKKKSSARNKRFILFKFILTLGFVLLTGRFKEFRLNYSRAEHGFGVNRAFSSASGGS